MGSFNNYVDQILSDYEPPTHLSGQKWTFYKPSFLCHVTHYGLFTDHHPLLQSTQLLNDPYNKTEDVHAMYIYMISAGILI